MLLPQFSLRTILALVPVAALLALAIANTASGGVWGLAVTMAVLCLIACVISYALFFLLCTMLASLVGSEEVVSRTSRGGIIRESATTPPQEPSETVPDSTAAESEN